MTFRLIRSMISRIIHTKFDDMDKLEELIPGVQMNHMRETSTIVSEMIRRMTLDSPAVYEPLYEGKVYTANGWVTYNHGVATDGNPPATEPPVTEPPVTEPPVTDPPFTDSPVTDAPGTDTPVTDAPETRESESWPDGSEGTSGEATDPAVPTVTKADPGKNTDTDKTEEEPDKEPEKKGRGNVLGFWLLEGSILLLIAGCAVYLILTSQEMKRRRRRRGRKNTHK